MGSHADVESIAGTGEPDKADPGAEHPGRPVHHQPGECLLAGGLLPERMAL